MITYLDTLSIISDAGDAGADYVKFSRAMKAHSRSLIAEGIVASFGFSQEFEYTEIDEYIDGWVLIEGSDFEWRPCSLDTKGAVLCVIETGANYVELLTKSGLLSSPVKNKRKTPSKPKATQSVPTPEESVLPESVPAVAPEGKKVRRVAGGKQDQAVIVKISSEDRMKALEAQLGALMDIIEGNLITDKA